jgi:glucans biosynthesis protein
MHLPMHQAPRCGAKTRSGKPCRSPGMPKNGRCRMHGGTNPGGPIGNQHALKHGRYSAEAIERRRQISRLLRSMRASASDVTD